MDLIKEDVDINHEEKSHIYITNKKPTFPKPTKYVIWQTALSLLCTKKGFDQVQQWEIYHQKQLDEGNCYEKTCCFWLARHCSARACCLFSLVAIKSPWAHHRPHNQPDRRDSRDVHREMKMLKSSSAVATATNKRVPKPRYWTWVWGVFSWLSWANTSAGQSSRHGHVPTHMLCYTTIFPKTGDWHILAINCQK